MAFRLLLILVFSLSFSCSQKNVLSAGKKPVISNVSLLERVTTVAPFPRGLVMVDGTLYVLCRGRVRAEGGVSALIDDQAGTIYAVDPNKSEPFELDKLSDNVRTNGKVFVLPTGPFKLWDRTSNPPERDRSTDRPYCTLRYHAQSKNFFICAFSGIDKPKQPRKVSFSKNLTDAVFRYDLRTRKWYEVERHDIESGGNYPHHAIKVNPLPHGLLNGPDNCLALGNQLYAVAKDNNLLVRYDLSEIVKNPEAGHPRCEPVLGDRIYVKGLGERTFYGHSALTFHNGWIYLAFRTSSVIVRFRLDKNYLPIKPIKAEIVGRFDPFDPKTLLSANITDIDFDDKGRLYVISAQPSRVFRFTPDPNHVFDGRNGKTPPYADFATLTDNPKMKSENILYHDGWLYVTSGDGYSYQKGAHGTVYRLKIVD